MKNALAIAITIIIAGLNTLGMNLQDQRTATALTTANDLKRSSAATEPAGAGSETQSKINAAIALSEAGQINEAIAALKQILKATPDHPETNFALGLTYQKANSLKNSYECFRKAVKSRPEWAEAQFKLGMTSLAMGKRPQSLDAYKKLVGLQSPLANELYSLLRTDKPAVPPTKTVNPNEAVNEPAKPVKSPEPAASEIYKVGVGDVLDIRFLSSVNTRSTLFTVLGGGLIDLPITGGSINVGGLTTDEIAALIALEFKRRAIDNAAQVSVGVRQYVSHSVVVTGLVASPGTRYLRRETVPLYVILAESNVRNDAGQITIMRAGTQGQQLNLSDQTALNTTVQAGDVVTVSGRLPEFYYIAGRIKYPGQKNFQNGITLLQAILAAGGSSRENMNTVELSRDGKDGRLVTSRFNIKQIKAGIVEDPRIQPGDRIEVMR